MILFNILYLTYTQVTQTLHYFMPFVLSGIPIFSVICEPFLLYVFSIAVTIRLKTLIIERETSCDSAWSSSLFCFIISMLYWEPELWFPHRQNKEAGGWLTVEFICLVNWVLIWPTIHLLQILFKCKVILWSCFSFWFICVNIMPYELP